MMIELPESFSNSMSLFVFLAGATVALLLFWWWWKQSRGTPNQPINPTSMDVLVIAASNGENLKLAERFVAQTRAQNLQSALVDLTAVDLPLFTPRRQKAGTPEALAGLERQMRAARNWVICAPEYNGSIPPVLTSAIAWLSVMSKDYRSLFNGRNVVIASHSGSGGHLGLAALRMHLAFLGCMVVGRQLISNRSQSATDDFIAGLVRLIPRPTT